MKKSYVVLDSGIFLATVTSEPFITQSDALIERCIRNKVQFIDKVQFIAPVLFQYEIVAVTRKWIHRNLMSYTSALMARNK